MFLAARAMAAATITIAITRDVATLDVSCHCVIVDIHVVAIAASTLDVSCHAAIVDSHLVTIAAATLDFSCSCHC